MESDIIYSNRQLDLKQENVIHQYMTMLYDEHGFSVKQPTREQDISGIDVILNRYGKEYLVDEKAAIKYLTRDLNTFSFELYKAGYRNVFCVFVSLEKLPLAILLSLTEMLLCYLNYKYH
jgi:ABC-type microcin C transport system permease subunit YejB